MARKHRRRTRKRGGRSVMDKMKEGVQGWKDIGTDIKARAEVGAQGMKAAYGDFDSGFKSKTQGVGGVMLGPVPGPPSSPPPTPHRMDLIVEPTKKNEGGGLLGLGWFGLGGRRLSHSAFINKMLRVRSKTKRNKSIRKYLKGGKKKTKKRKVSKKTKTKRRRRKRR